MVQKHFDNPSQEVQLHTSQQVFQEHYSYVKSVAVQASGAWLCVHSSPDLSFLAKVDLVCKIRSQQIIRWLQLGTRTEIA